MFCVLFTDALVAGSLSGVEEGGSQCMTSQDTSQGSGGMGRAVRDVTGKAVEGSLDKKHSRAFKGFAPGVHATLNLFGNREKLILNLFYS